MDPQILQLIQGMQSQINSLSAEIRKNNFPGRQDFNKPVSFTVRLKVPVYSSLPSTCEQGELCSVSGKLYVASATNTWVVAGTQT